MNFQLVIIIGVAGTYVMGSALESFAWRNTAGWSTEARQRIVERVQSFERQLRVMDILSFVLILSCVLRLAGVLSSIVPIIYAPRGLVVAVGLLALERVLRGWLTWRAFSTEENAEANSTAMQSALASTLLQIALAAWVGWWVLTKVSAPKKRTPGGATTVQTPGGTSGTGTETDEDPPPPIAKSNWMTEAEALQYCGKDKAYLDRLTLHVRGMFADPLRSMVEGREMYRRDYLEQIKVGGFPSLEEMKNAQPPAPKPPKPLTEGDLLKEP
jgi:hypothetical protein